MSLTLNIQYMSNYFLNGATGKVTKFDAHKPPEFKELKSNDFVQYGYDKEWKNRYPDYLLYLYNRSAKNNAIINGKNKYIVGQGWTFDNNGLTFEQRISLKAFIKELEHSKITRDLSLDRTVFGGFACEIITSNDSENITLSHIDFSKVRQYKTVTDKEGNKSPLKYGYTSDWSNRNPQDNEDFEELYLFTWDKDDIDSNKRYIVYYKEYRPDLQEYPLPDYIGAVPYIEADYEISNFTLNNVKNGFSGSFLVNFYNGEPTEEQKGQIERRWKQTKHGSDNAGAPILSFNEDKDSGVEVTALPANGQDERYINLNKQIQGEIYTGHQFNPSIIGISDSNGFNNNADEIRIASEMFQNTYVDSEQKVLEEFFNSVAGYNGLPEELSIVSLEVITNPLSEQTLLQILTQDELREKAGYKPLKSDFSNDKVFSFEQYFASCGVNDSDLELLDSRDLFALNIPDANKLADKFKADYFASKSDITILSLLALKTPIKDIADQMNKSVSEIEDINAKLIEEELINSEGEVTPKGESEIRQNEVFVVYKYKLRNDAPPLVAGGSSRDFCKDLMQQSQNKSWTRAEINNLNNGQGSNVFSARGGWYHNPKNDVNTPFCRHIWEQRLVRFK